MAHNNDNLTIPRILESVSQAVPSSVCGVVEGSSGTRRLTYGNAWNCLRQHEKWLQETINNLIGGSDHHHHVPYGGRDIVVAFLSGNSIDLLLSMLACTSLLSTTTSSSSSSSVDVAALLNTRWTASEMAKSLKSTRKDATTILLYGPGFETVAQDVVQQIDHKAHCIPLQNFSLDFLEPSGRSFVDEIGGGGEPPIRADNISEMIQRIQVQGSAKDAFIVFTSGTTGGSKGVRLSHRALSIQSLAKIDNPCGYSSKTTMLASTVPLFHVGGLSSCLAVMFAGGRLFFPEPKSIGFSANMVRASLENAVCPTNTLVVVPAMLSTYFSDPASKNRVYKHVRLILVGGQSASESMVQDMKVFFPKARIVQTFACTEAASSLTFRHINPPPPPTNDDNHPKRPSSNTTNPAGAALNDVDCVGVSPAHVHIRIYRKGKRGDWNILSMPNEIGVIATRGPHVMNGYWARGGENNDIKGWFLTTDLGSVDENGRLYFRGRIKDVIRTGGETVFAQEVERVVLKLPQIQACAVFPRQDERFGEAVACAIVLMNPNDDHQAGPSLNIGSIKEWCNQHGLATYKRPRYLFLVDSLPTNSSGKVLKHKLVESYGKLLQSKL